ncbi:MAG: class I SAM-dependent methyltransferase [Epulopiscium sp.]|nr:class I SAM-dependent methyltransferase [Candidatus Epulonipiscium sp.]
MDFENKSFYVVISRNVTHTLRYHETVYREWNRVLKPEGRLLIFDANWHLPCYDQELLIETIRRGDECLRLYGSTFNGKKEILI